MSPLLLPIAILVAVILLGALMTEVYDAFRRRYRLVLPVGPALILAIWARVATAAVWAVTMRLGP